MVQACDHIAGSLLLKSSQGAPQLKGFDPIIVEDLEKRPWIPTIMTQVRLHTWIGIFPPLLSTRNLVVIFNFYGLCNQLAIATVCFMSKYWLSLHFLAYWEIAHTLFLIAKYYYVTSTTPGSHYSHCYQGTQIHHNIPYCYFWLTGFSQYRVEKIAYN